MQVQTIAEEVVQAEPAGWLKRNQERLIVAASGLSIGGLGVWLSYLGNPPNSGICISCFMENLAGSLGLHGNARMQSVRPELAGFVLGALLVALIAKEFKAEGGSSPLLRFMGGVILIIGCSVFMGCPIKMALRLGAGDFTAVAGLVGMVLGVWLGFAFLRRGFYLGDPVPLPAVNALVVPVLMAGALVAVLVKASFLQISSTGPGSQKAPFAIALGAGLLIGALAQKSRFCVTGSIGNFLVSRDSTLLTGFLAMIGSAVVVSLLVGSFSPGLQDQPGSHLAYGWSFLGLFLVGITSVLIGGCPFRQLILASQGSADAAAAVFGMLVGGALVQAWGIASTNQGPSQIGKVATLVSLACVLIVGAVLRMKDEEPA